MLLLAVVLLIMGGCGIAQERVLLENFTIEIEEVDWSLYRATGTAIEPWIPPVEPWIPLELKRAVLIKAREYCEQENRPFNLDHITMKPNAFIGDSTYEIDFRCYR